MLHLVTDSSCDLPEEILKKYDIRVIPLTVHIDGESYRENVDISPKEFYSKMALSKELPKTSQPSPGMFADVFTELSKTGPVLCITISSGLSGTYQAACLGKELSGADITLFDSLVGSLGHGLCLLKAAKLAESGYSLPDIVRELEKYRDEMTVFVLLNTLDNIVRGGRLSKVQGTLGKLLNIRVLLRNDKDGKVVIQEKVRGNKKLMETVIQRIVEIRPDMTGMAAGVTHFNNPADAEAIKRALTEICHAESVLINDMGTTMATYAGEGGMIVSF